MNKHLKISILKRHGSLMVIKIMEVMGIIIENILLLNQHYLINYLLNFN